MPKTTTTRRKPAPKDDRPEVRGTQSAGSVSDKFQVGQHCILVLDEKSGWAPMNGEPCVVLKPKTLCNILCSDWDGKNQTFEVAQQRYLIRWRDGYLGVLESQLRAIYDGEPLSTWAKFTKATGINPLAEDDDDD